MPHTEADVIDLVTSLQECCIGKSIDLVFDAIANLASAAVGVSVETREEADHLAEGIGDSISELVRANWEYLSTMRGQQDAGQSGGH